MLKGWSAGFAPIVVALLSSVLILIDINDGGFRRWWSAHAFTTDVVAGILVLLITVLIVNQLLNMRQRNERARAVAAQVAILLGEAHRATRAVVSGGDSDDRGTSPDEVRTYMTMLMIAATRLIEAKDTRTFLEEAQALGGQLVETFSPFSKRYHETRPSSADLEEALRRLTILAEPLLGPLTPEERIAAGAAET